MGGGFVDLDCHSNQRASPRAKWFVLSRIFAAERSGRNGGFVLSWMSKLSSLAKLCGIQEALRIARVPNWLSMRLENSAEEIESMPTS